jgi:peptidoglycan/xylan/chitin deacetylase (PgdA/CDA1 family)
MRALSLEYHDVVLPDAFAASGYTGPGPDSYKLTIATFSSHLDAIAAATGTPAARATDWLDNPRLGRPLFFTFDDGGVSGYEHAASRLEQHGWRGHFFVTAGRIGTYGFVTGSQIRALRQRGHVIGTHSYGHPALLGAHPADRILDEWRRSIDVLEDILEEPVVTGSVPGGFYTKTVGEAASRAGLRLLFTSCPTMRCARVGACLIVGRYTLRRWSSASAAAQLARGSPIARGSQWVVYRTLHLARALAGDRYTQIRQVLWERLGSRRAGV